MIVDPEALKRAMRARFPPPELAPDASVWMHEFVAALGSNPFVHRERDVLKFLEAPLNKLKSEPPEVRLAFVFEALAEIPRNATFHFKLALKVAVAFLLRGGLPLSAVDAVRMVELMSRKNLPFPFKAVLSAVDSAPRTPALLTALHMLRGCVTSYHGGPEMKEIHERIDVLIGGAKEKALAPAGAWSQIVFREISTSEKKFEWDALLLHARSLTQSTASAKWQAEAVNLATRIGAAEVLDAARRWLAPGPTAGETMVQSPEAEATYQKGFVWVLGALGDTSIAPDIANFAFGCFRKIPMIGAISHRAGNACVNALAAMPGLDGVAQLSRLAGKVKYDVARRLIEKAMNEAAERNHVSRDALEAMAVPTFGLNADGVRTEAVGDCEARLAIGREGASLTWSREGKPLKSVPANIKEEHSEPIKDLNRELKELDGQIAAQRFRLERQLISEGTCSYERWKPWYLDHPLVSHFATRIIWEFETDGQTRTAIPWKGKLVDWAGHAVKPASEARVRMWHPIRSGVQEILSWRCWLEDHAMRQPFKQAHREVYLLTDAERETGTYSNRFASHIIRQHQFASLCRERGWKFKVMGNFDSHNTPSLDLPSHNLQAKFDVESPEADDGDDESTTAHGIYLAISTGRIQFSRIEAAAEEHDKTLTGPFGLPFSRKFRALRRKPALRLEEVPALVFSEVMRDCDLFVGVTSIGTDPAWNRDHPGDPHLPYWEQFAFGDLTTASEHRREVLESLLPKLAIRDRCRIDGRFLVVHGDLHEYRIHIGSGNILIEPGSRYLCIVQGPGDTAASLPLPFEGDRILALVLSKAMLLVNDKKIKDPAIARQLA